MKTELENKMKEELDGILSCTRIQLGSDRAPTTLFYFLENEVCLELYTESKELYLSYRLWSHFVSKFGSEICHYKMSLNEIFRDYIESHLQIKGLYIYIKRN